MHLVANRSHSAFQCSRPTTEPRRHLAASLMILAIHRPTFFVRTVTRHTNYDLRLVDTFSVVIIVGNYNMNIITTITLHHTKTL